MKKSKFIINIILFCLIIGILTAVLFISPATDISESERRKLQQFPELSFSTLMSGKFMKNFETYMTDQFPLRDAFRKLKAKVHFDIYNQSDNGGIYVKEGFVSKIDSEYSESSTEHFTGRMNNLYDMYLKDKNCRVYYSIIPDKNYYLAGEDYPTMDYEKLFRKVREDLSYMTEIDIKDTLSKESFYYTDTHWRQEKITATAEKIRKEMGMAPLGEYKEENAGDFYGVYYGQSALSLPAEPLNYLKNAVTDKATTYNYETKKEAPVYNTDKLTESLDKYDLFLSGPCSLMDINNPSGEKGKQLIIFRDSYGSSLAPLLISDYEKVVLIDTRYITPEMLGEYVEFENSDVLFIYSTLLINSSSTIK